MAVKGRLMSSVVTRLVLALVVGGLVVSAALTVLELQHAEPEMKMNLSREVAQLVRNFQGLLRNTIDSRNEQQLEQMLHILTQHPLTDGAKIELEGHRPICSEGWPSDPDDTAAHWTLAEHAMPMGDEVAIDRPTLLVAPFTHNGKVVTLSVLVDGPAARKRIMHSAMEALTGQWLVMSVMTLLGLLLLRRWFTGPLEEVVTLVAANAGPEPFYAVARRSRGEFRQLGESIGGMLTRLECTTQQLRKRESAFQNLYQFAPAAMLSLRRDGHVFEANRKAAQLLRLDNEAQLVSRDAFDLVHPRDGTLLRQAIDKVEVQGSTRCELRMIVPGDSREEAQIVALVEVSGVRNEDGVLESVRLSLQDISQSRQLQQQLADQSRLMNMVINHMSDAILLVNAQGLVAAHNDQLLHLLNKTAVLHTRYDPATFWNELGVVDREAFLGGLSRISADDTRPAQARFDTRLGTLQFQGIPVHDGNGQSLGRLWVIQEVSGQAQSRRLMDQQKTQLEALKRLGQRINNTENVDDLLENVVQVLHEATGVEAVGVALRRHDAAGHGGQLLHRGATAYRYESNKLLVDNIERHVIPLVLANQELTFWQDLPKEPWARVVEQAGLTAIAGTPMSCGSDTQGILWIAQRCGEKIDQGQLFLLDAAAPLVAAQLTIAHLNEQLHSLELTDAVTQLPNARHFRIAAQKLANRPGQPWSVVLVNLDHFRKLNEVMDHQSADLVLKTIARALRRASRRSNFIARLNGATFGLLCPGLGREDTVNLADRLREMIASQELALTDGQTWQLTASIGVSISEGNRSAVEMLDVTAGCLENAKRSGRNRVVVEDATHERKAG
ncbi:MAG: diguanylate cyclase [Phycisphaera sp.]|nr:diguanylate cyclase [Phycisphaera sp.]